MVIRCRYTQNRKPLLFSSPRLTIRERKGTRIRQEREGRGIVTMPVAVQCTSGHEVVQQVRPTGEPDETTSGHVVPSCFPSPVFLPHFASTWLRLSVSFLLSLSTFYFFRHPQMLIDRVSILFFGEEIALPLKKRFIYYYRTQC